MCLTSDDGSSIIHAMNTKWFVSYAWSHSAVETGASPTGFGNLMIPAELQRTDSGFGNTVIDSMHERVDENGIMGIQRLIADQAFHGQDGIRIVLLNIMRLE